MGIGIEGQIDVCARKSWLEDAADHAVARGAAVLSLFGFLESYMMRGIFQVFVALSTWHFTKPSPQETSIASSMQDKVRSIPAGRKKERPRPLARLTRGAAVVRYTFLRSSC
eukprot:scaffold2207_cov370-Prasinococcus_capsulatus_cf.AAC.9